MEIAAGVVIRGRYHLERLIGKGGMGVVWAAEDVVAHERVALKFLHGAGSDRDATQRLLREARVASVVRHPGVVQTFDVIELADGGAVLVMELLTGESLRAVLQRTPRLSLRELAEILVPVAAAVGAAHALGVVHRDLKPENIFVSRSATGDRAVKILDFGIAKLTALDGAAMQSTGNTTGAVLGTPAYMAPEQVFGERDLDHRADIWSLGVIAYQCLSGVLPTEGAHVGQVLKNVLSRPFAPLGELVPELPAPIARLVARMLERERAHRLADLREVVEVFAPIARGDRAGFAPRAVRGRLWLGIPAVAVLGVAATLRFSPSRPSSSSDPPRSCPDDMVRVPAGTFAMGSPLHTGRMDEHPRHEVTLSGYCIDKLEVTVAAYEACANAGQCSPALRTVNHAADSPGGPPTQSSDCNDTNRANHPINCVDWTQADAYCAWRHKRLPTEAEWEYAARGSDGRGYPWGNEAPSATRVNGCGTECEQAMAMRAMYPGDDGAVTTAPVGRYPDGASPFGALDMAGNVSEWTADRYGIYPRAAATDPHGAETGDYRVCRGGGWGDGWKDKRAAVMRSRSLPETRNPYLGFRCARGG